MLETTRCAAVSRRFGDLRGVQWRIDLGILPSSPSASVDDLRRVTADSRRRYAALRRQLLVDPHVPKSGGSSPDVVIDNPLSQNPDSMWGRFFKNAELERMVDQDLTRLYPERGSYFQTNGCQSMLRRILLLWCLRHPEFGYRQGMHELLAPLLYVLHADVERLLEVRKTYDDQFADKFDGFSFHENDLTYRFDFKKFSESMDHCDNLKKNYSKPGSPSELDPQIQTIILLSDAYGAEGELGIVLSEKFMEHDTYCMFDALMNGAGGAVAMAEFFSPSPMGSSQIGFPPVIEASAALYHLLSIADSSLYSHLVELGVEPQYFALRWLRVLFGREFSLEDLLLIWDEIFAHENSKCNKGPDVNADSNFGILESPRGAFICAFAVSMILTLRSSLLATENATTCLKRLLNFPEDVKLVKLLEKAKSLHPEALDANNSNSIPIYPGLYDGRTPAISRRHSLSLDGSPKTPLNMVSDSYWEEKWRGLHKEEKNVRTSGGEQVPNRRRGWTERVRLRLSRTESDPSPAKEIFKNKIPKPSVRRNLLKDLERQLGFDEDKESTTGNEDAGNQDSLEVPHQDTSEVHRQDSLEVHHQDSMAGRHQDLLEVSSDDIIVKDNGARSSVAASEENVSNLSYPSSPGGSSYGNENEPEPERPSSFASNSSIDGHYAESSVTFSERSPLPMSDPAGVLSSEHPQDVDPAGKVETSIKDRKHIMGKFQWLWKFARNAGDDGTDKSNTPEDPKTCNGKSEQKSAVAVSNADACKGGVVDQNLMSSLNNLGQTMLENIQVIESAFQQDRGQPGSLENFSKNGLVGKGQVTALAALKELRKISNLLSEM